MLRRSTIFVSDTFQIICGDGVHICQPSPCRYIRAVALGLQSVYLTFISMTSSAEKATINSQFLCARPPPCCFSIVDGTHIRIQKPSEDEADYLNRYSTAQ